VAVLLDPICNWAVAMAVSKKNDETTVAANFERERVTGASKIMVQKMVQTFAEPRVVRAARTRSGRGV
jgi:hypothetical protein